SNPSGEGHRRQADAVGSGLIPPSRRCHIPATAYRSRPLPGKCSCESCVSDKRRKPARGQFPDRFWASSPRRDRRSGFHLPRQTGEQNHSGVGSDSLSLLLFSFRVEFFICIPCVGSRRRRMLLLPCVPVFSGEPEPLPHLVVAQDEKTLLFQVQMRWEAVVFGVEAVGDVVDDFVQAKGDSVLLALPFELADVMTSILEQADIYALWTSRSATEVTVDD